ncbi:MAG TPA: TauD/TfdA family dioxygenase [Pyrinomonadaceae bacterium]|nr:TauD/TfdA family dioxygenase [Pyrinomonadaceae bacterium]
MSTSGSINPERLQETAFKLYEAAKTEQNPVIAASMIKSAERLFNFFGASAISQEAKQVVMGDQNIVTGGQVGSMGSGSKAEGNTFNQNNTEGQQPVDMKKLTDELGALSQKILEMGYTPENIATAGAVANAQIALKGNDSSSAQESLTKAGEAALEMANALGMYEAAEALRRSGIATPEDRARIHPWAQLPHEEFLVEEEKIGDLAQRKILHNLERYGICLLRPVGQEAKVQLVESLITMLGTATEWQNEEKGPIKDIRPKEGVDPNTGDSKGDLGFHVDGTQAVEQPPVLLFQYALGAPLGGHSKFADAARIIRDIPEERRYQLLANLARPDAATFTKREMRYQGPILSYSPTDQLMFRVRFDDVIDVHAECREDFELLKEKFNDPYYPSVFQPRNADLVIFDNWRVMHARTEVYGDRHHRRVWFNNLRLEHQPKCYLGIRPIPKAVAAEIERQNGS